VSRRGTVPTHFFAFQLTEEAIPRLSWSGAEDPVLCHSCDSRGRTNQAHLRLGTTADNRAEWARQNRDPGGPLADFRGAAGRTRAFAAAVRTGLALGESPEQIGERIHAAEQFRLPLTLWSQRRAAPGPAPDPGPDRLRRGNPRNRQGGPARICRSDTCATTATRRRPCSPKRKPYSREPSPRSTGKLRIASAARYACPGCGTDLWDSTTPPWGTTERRGGCAFRALDLSGRLGMSSGDIPPLRSAAFGMIHLEGAFARSKVMSRPPVF